MNKSEMLIQVFAQSVALGGGLHSAAQLAFLLEVKYSPAFAKFLSDSVKKGIIRRVSKNVYESLITPPDPATAIYKTARKLREGVLNYISLETQLSHTGDISQVICDRLTIMTAGRSGLFITSYGIIEFTHTKKNIHIVKQNLYFDTDIKMYRAQPEQAIADLRACRRNLHMLDD